MKRLLCILLAVGLAALLCACGGNSPEKTEDTSATTLPPQPTQTAAPNAPSAAQALPSEVRDGQVIFDFAELPQSAAPKGLWSVAELAKQYGPAESALGTYLKDYNLIFPRAQFAGYYVQFAHALPGEFSLDTAATPDMTVFDFNEEALKLKMEIVLVRSTDPAAELPRGIRIGDAKADVLAAYPPDSGAAAVTEEMDEIYYMYETRNEAGAFDASYGSIAYFFAEGVLESAEITWRYYDL